MVYMHGMICSGKYKCLNLFYRCLYKQRQSVWEQSWAHVMRERGCWQTHCSLRERDWPRMPRIRSHSLTSPERGTPNLCQHLTTSRYSKYHTQPTNTEFWKICSI